MIAGRRERAVDALALVALKVALGAWLLHAGFTHVSDDDYARAVISEHFARAPALDPSGTSWLPLPFWLEGAAMAALGTSLGVARAVAVALGAVSVAPPYLAMRAAGMARAAALAATATAMALPWSAWLGVATVPEGWAGALVAAGVLSMATAAARPWAAACLLAGSLCRYEAWPACAMLAALCTWRAARGGDVRRELAGLGLAALGPALWMAWNAHAHDGPLHFLSRVAAFRQAVGAAGAPLIDKLLDYPRALPSDAPVAVALGAAGLAGLAAPAARARWAWAAATCAAVVVFLAWGDARDGAPTHHPGRALVAVGWVLSALGVDALFAAHARAIGNGASRTVAGVAAGAIALACAVGSVLGWAGFPGQGESERREPQIARGLELRRRGAAHVTLTPCAFEHFALLAAWGEPDRATVAPRTGQPPTAACPGLTEP